MKTPIRNLILASVQILLAGVLITVAISSTSVDSARTNQGITIYWAASGLLWSIMAYSTYRKFTRTAS